MKHIKICLALLLSLSGCLAQTETNPTPAEAEPCPVVACAWTPEGTCTADSTFASSQGVQGTENDGANTCMFYNTLCVPKGTRAECVPDACRREQVTCQPTVNPGRP